jgi:N-acetylglucosamine kinase-like BadF-type ATPase
VGLSVTGSSGQPAVLAIDGGNSKTDVALIAADGTVLASLRGPGASQEDYGIDGAMRILGGLVREVTAKAGAAVDGPVARHLSACLAGCDLPSEEESLTAALRAQGWSATAVAMNDTFAVLRAGLPDAGATMSGVAVTCGAGINCVAVSPEGRTFRYLALGELTGDWGGGWGLAKAIMWHAMRGSDGRGPETDLGASVAAHFGLASVSDVTVAIHQGRLGETDLVAMAPPVLFQVAATGDGVALRLVARQAQEVCVMAVTAMRQLGMNTAGTEIVLGGGLLQAGDPLLSRELEASFAMDAPGAIIRVASVPPIAGAALLGLDHLGVSVAAKERLRQSFATGASGTRGAGELSVYPLPE